MQGWRFGVIADVQYALAASGWDFHRTQERHYRFSRVAMQAAIGEFDKAGVTTVLQLGDLLDGQCKKTDPHSVLADLLHDWKPCPSVLHVLGNHELYCFDKSECAKLMGLTAWNYAMAPAPGWKVLVLDSYRLSTLTTDTEMEAFRFLSNKNPNNVRSNQVDWLAGLAGTARRFVPYNGGLGEEQLQWLARELDCDERVIIAAHVPLLPGSCDPECLAWDYEEALEVIAKGRARVVAVFAGHDHSGGYAFDARSKTHHITMQSPMVCRNKGQSTAHAIVHVTDTHLMVQGSGSVPTRRLDF